MSAHHLTCCSIPGCHRRSRKRGWCTLHYDRWKRHGDPTKTLHRKICSVPGCGRRHSGLGYCLPHWKKLKKYGDALWKPKPIICRNCGKEFVRLPRSNDQAAFCSHRCSLEDFYLKRCASHEMRSCERCGTSFKPRGWGDRPAIYCVRCRGIIAAIKRIAEATCRVCGSRYSSSSPDRKICKKCTRRKMIARIVRRNTRRRAIKRGALGPSHTEAQWQALLKFHSGLCAYCKARPAEHRDHVVPISKHGSDGIANILPACADCNTRKGSMSLEEWRVKFRKIHGYAWTEAYSYGAENFAFKSG